MVETDETGKTTFHFRHAAEGPVFVVGDFNSVLVVPKVPPVVRETVRLHRTASACLAATA
jgi:hypothetical protein